jgi:topoisomerase-4 subunit A
MTKPVEPPDEGTVETVGLQEALEERYLAYALSTIMHRALPDARDGLKPVHRRILYGMNLLRLNPGGPFKKSAKVVGDVMGSFHPHGDQAIYDALVRLAQDFASRYPLVDGQGNFGNIDGDSAAAYRYTEARMTDVARLLLDGIDENAVDFRPNYDGTTRSRSSAGGLPEPACQRLSGHRGRHGDLDPAPQRGRTLRRRALSRRPSGGDLGRSRQFRPRSRLSDRRHHRRRARRHGRGVPTGRGSFRVRARWAREETGAGVWAVVVTEIPYGIPKSRLIEKIAELVNEKKLPLLADVRDESAEDVRIVFEPRSRTVDPTVMMESLFRLTELEARVPMNVNVLAGGKVPKVLGLAECLREWLDHRRDVLGRRSRFRLAAIERRLEILGGLLIVYLDLDR